MRSVERVTTAVELPLSDANIRRRYEIEKAAWIWHPSKTTGDMAVLRFVNEFEADAATETRFHVSADQRYELRIDDELVSLGPDRSDIDHWSFASYNVSLEPGPHRLEIIVWWIGEKAPTAQLTYRGGFILAAEGELAHLLNTGSEHWTVADVTAWSFEQRPGDVGTMMVGAYPTIDGKRWFDTTVPAVKPAVVLGPLEDSQWCSARAGWKLHPSDLPDQMRTGIRPGRIIAVIDGGLSPEDALQARDLNHPDVAAWQQLLVDPQRSLQVPGGTTVSVLWDLEDYYCGYNQAVLSGGSDSELSMIWAESLFERPASQWSKHKGPRDERIGKYFRGTRDTFANDGGARRAYSGPWWRAGRYVLLTVRTASEPLTIDGLRVRETRYPLENLGQFECDDPSVTAVQSFCLRGLQMCAHETFMDCPHYEQLQYIGDTRLQALCMYTLIDDPRLPRRTLQIFDWSRWMHGYVNSAYPAGPQMISTFPLYYVMMVRDYAFWRDDMESVHQTMIGVRATLEQYMHLRRSDGLLDTLPGWPFVDTVPEWIDTIYGPDPKKGANAIVNLLYAYALQKAAELEDIFGETEMATRNRRLADQTAQEVLKRFWVRERGLFADDVAKTTFSQHAQILALLTSSVAPAQRQPLFEKILGCTDLAQAQPMYWMFYLFELFHEFGRGDLLLAKMGIWKDLIKTGLKTPPEMFEPTRSDCHGWGSHPLFHLQATIAGIRPAAPGFAKVDISPSPGPLRSIRSRVPHPKGFVEVHVSFAQDGSCIASVDLPAGICGTFRWGEKNAALHPGRQQVQL